MRRDRRELRPLESPASIERENLMRPTVDSIGDMKLLNFYLHFLCRVRHMLRLAWLDLIVGFS